MLWLIYADITKNFKYGLNKGIHLWSVRALPISRWSSNAVRHCFASIGVSTEKDTKIINEFKHDGTSTKHWNETGFYSFYQGCSKWADNETITVKLNCNDWTVTYFNDKKQIQKDQIEPNQYYYFMLLC